MCYIHPASQETMKQEFIGLICGIIEPRDLQSLPVIGVTSAVTATSQQSRNSPMLLLGMASCGLIIRERLPKWGKLRHSAVTEINVYHRATYIVISL